MTTIATSDVHAALERAAEQLRSAGGPDGVVSRQDIRTRLLALEGAERELVDVLYRFIDGRDAARSARVTKSDIDAAVASIRTEIIDRHDLDRSGGLSDEEIASMSELGKHAVALARTLKDASAPRGEALAQHLAKLAQGVWQESYGSEGGEGFAPFHAAANLSELTRDSFRATLGFTADRPEHEIVKFEAPDYFFNRFLATHSDPEVEEHERAKELVQALRTHLRDIAVALLGADDMERYPSAEHPLYVVGIDAAGNLVGLKSAVIWT